MLYKVVGRTQSMENDCCFVDVYFFRFTVFALKTSLTFLIYVFAYLICVIVVYKSVSGFLIQSRQLFNNVTPTPF